MNRHAGAPSVLDALRHHALIGPDETCHVHDLHQRSLCFRVERDGGPVLFVKRAQPLADGTWSADVAAEGRALRHLAAVPGLRPLVPALLAADDDPPTIVLEHLGGHVTLGAARHHPAVDPHQLLTDVGRAAATVHQVHPSTDLQLPAVNHPAGLLRLWSCVTPRQITQHPDAYRELAARLQASGLLTPLAELASSWTADRLVHGDLKADNVLCRPTAAGTEVRLIDWEAAGWGDPCWDLGSLLGDQLLAWLRGLAIEPGGQLSSWLASGDQSADDLRRSTTAILEGYRQASPDGLDGDRLTRSARYAGVFLVHRLTAGAMSSPRLTAQLLLTLQLAGRLLTHPERALEVLL